jgi:hypothetical protein
MANLTSCPDLLEKLSSYDAYQDFMKGKEDIEKLKSCVDEKLDLPAWRHLNNRDFLNKISYIVKDVLRRIAFLAKIFVSSYYSRKFEGYLSREFLKKRHGRLFLTPTENYCYDLHKVTVAASEIDSKLKSFSLSLQENNNGRLRFNNGGDCRGMSNYFIYLYLATKEFYKNKNPEEHIRKIAEMFKEGASIRSAFLQEFHHSTSNSYKFIWFSSVYSQNFFNPLNRQDQIIKTMETLPHGIYSVSMEKSEKGHVKGHMCVLIKPSGTNLLYFWDPNKGLFAATEELALWLCEDYLGENSWLSLNRVEDTTQKDFKAIFYSMPYPDIFVVKAPRFTQYLPRDFCINRNFGLGKVGLVKYKFVEAIRAVLNL